jgi:hypothetical protein
MTYIHTYIHTRISAFMTCPSVQVCQCPTRIHTYIHIYIHTWIHALPQAYRSARTHTYTYIYVYIHTYFHIHDTLFRAGLPGPDGVSDEPGPRGLRGPPGKLITSRQFVVFLSVCFYAGNDEYDICIVESP